MFLLHNLKLKAESFALADFLHCGGLKAKDYNKTLNLCHSSVGIAILNTSITIVFGFSILVMSNFIPTIYFGIKQIDVWYQKTIIRFQESIKTNPNL